MATRLDRITIAYTIEFETPFHFGTGSRVGLIDRTVIRDSNEYLYIPGSTLKGVLREHCEQLARFYAPDQENKKDILDPHDARAVIFSDLDNPSMVTRIFGSQQLSGRLFFDDLHQDEETRQAYEQAAKENVSAVNHNKQQLDEWKQKYKNIQVGHYTQVRIDRATHTAVKGALYTSEFGLKGIKFQGAITGWLECTEIAALKDNIDIDPKPTYSLLLLLAGLQMITRLGGNKSTGKGQCRCKIQTLEVNGNRLTPEQRNEWLEHIDELSAYPGFTTSKREP